MLPWRFEMPSLKPMLLLAIAINLFWMRKTGWRWFYQVLATVEPNDFSVMNYGYAGETVLDLDQSEKDEQYGFQMYHHVLSPIDCNARDILEVGCGRGGGAFFVRKYLNPRKVMGLDLSDKAIALCNQRFAGDGLEFYAGDAEDLPFPERSFDIVLNIESAFCYPHRDRFYKEVYRVLRDGGHFVYADINRSKIVPTLDRQLQEAGFRFIKKELINENVIRATDIEAEDRRKRINDLSRNPLFRWVFRNLNVIPGSYVYKKLKAGELQYSCYALRKGN
jgi:ubiquinone/menaquinone biosynthesis C-methylase UbiE